MKTQQTTAQQKPADAQKRETGFFNTENGKRIESKNEFRDAFRKRKLVINI